MAFLGLRAPLINIKAPLRDTPFNSLFLDTLQEVEFFTFIYLSIVRAEVILSRESWL